MANDRNDPGFHFKDVMVRIPLELFKFIDDWSRRDDRSWAWVVRACVDREMARQKAEGAPSSWRD